MNFEGLGTNCFTRYQRLLATGALSQFSSSVQTSAASHPLPIHQITFPRSPLPIPDMAGPPPPRPPHSQSPLAHYDVTDELEVPRIHKLMFPTFDGKTDPLGWLNVDTYQHHHWKPAMASADVNGVAGISWATNKSASARSTAVVFDPRVTRGVIYIFARKAAMYRI